MTFSPPSRTRELYFGEIWQFREDRWKLIFTSWGYPVEDNRWLFHDDFDDGTIPFLPHVCPMPEARVTNVTFGGVPLDGYLTGQATFTR